MAGNVAEAVLERKGGFSIKGYPLRSTIPHM
jgi:hypothetical protein